MPMHYLRYSTPSAMQHAVNFQHVCMKFLLSRFPSGTDYEIGKSPSKNSLLTLASIGAVRAMTHSQ